MESLGGSRSLKFLEKGFQRSDGNGRDDAPSRRVPGRSLMSGSSLFCFGRPTC